MGWFTKKQEQEVQERNQRNPLMDEITGLKNSINSIVDKSIKDTLKEITGLTDDISSLHSQIETLKRQKQNLNDEILTAKKTKELEQLETEHLIRLKEERMKLDSEKKEIELEKKFQQKEQELKDKHFENVLKTIKEQQADTKELYQNIMKVLPNVNVDIVKESTTTTKKK